VGTHEAGSVDGDGGQDRHLVEVDASIDLVRADLDPGGSDTGALTRPVVAVQDSDLPFLDILAAAQAGMLAGAGALSGCSGRGRRICQGLGVSQVVIDSTPGNGGEAQSDATIGTAPGSGRLFDTLKLWAWQLAPSWLPHCRGRWPDSGKQGRAPSLCGPSVPD
jgi:hypothetical protein